MSYLSNSPVLSPNVGTFAQLNTRLMTASSLNLLLLLTIVVKVQTSVVVAVFVIHS